jgi:Cation/multidrug efflux pump
MQPTIQVKGQFRTAYDMQDLVVKSIYGNSVYLRDISQIIDTAKGKESYSRLGNKNVVTLQIIKRAGENLINTADKISALW